jgi:hypothetical protein
MVARASEPASLTGLRGPLGEGTLQTVPQGLQHGCEGGGAHSRLADGRQWCWRPGRPLGRGWALDVELADQPVSAALGRRLPPDDPWAWWTRAEVCAKLFAVPIIVWVTREGWPSMGPVHHQGALAHVGTLKVDGVVASLGWLQS